MTFKKILYFIVLILLGSVLLSPQLYFHEVLAQGDHGRDLYAFEKTLSGQMPYRDYWWVYGPLMPSFYGFFFSFLGESIKTVLIIKFVLKILAGVVFYLILANFVSLPLGLIAAAWFWTYNPDFFFTYNHIGGVVMLLCVIHALARYITTSQRKFIYIGFFYIFVLSLIKVNIGVFSLTAFILSIAFTDFIDKNPNRKETRKSCFFISLGLLAVVFFIYWFLLRSLPLYAIRQCLPYLQSDHPHTSTVLGSLRILWRHGTASFLSSPLNMVFGTMILLIGLQAAILLFIRNKKEKITRNIFFSLIFGLLLFAIFNSHEFIASGVFYRLYWVWPCLLLLLFLSISISTQHFSNFGKGLVYGFFLFLLVSQNSFHHQLAHSHKDPAHYLSLPKGQVYVANPPSWVKTAEDTSRYLMKNLKEEETFLALPYEPLYYFLTDKDSPTRQLIFFDHINIPRGQEEEIIGQLERQNVNYILISSRRTSRERGLGSFGKTNCLLLGKYIEENFEVVKLFGNWQDETVWAFPHGTMVLKRKNPL